MLTIVITYYNLKYFQFTLESLSLQTCNDFKVFIGNDSSPEDPSHLIEKYKNILNIQYVDFSENIGGKDLVQQWIRCLDFVESPFFMILGDDDMLSENAVEEFYKTHEMYPNLNVYRLSIRRINEIGKFTTEIKTYNDFEKSTTFFAKKYDGKALSSLGEYIFKTDIVKKVRIKTYPKAFYSDDRLVLEVSNFDSIKNIEHGISYIRVSENSFSGNNKYEIFSRKAAIAFIKNMIDDYRDKFTKKELFSMITHCIRIHRLNPELLSFREVFNMIAKTKTFLFVPLFFLGVLIRKLKMK